MKIKASEIKWLLVAGLLYVCSLSALAFAWTCAPPCDDCHRCVFGSCVRRCPPEKCCHGSCCDDICCGDGYCCNPDDCQSCVGGRCVVCNGDPAKGCCDGSCCDHRQCKGCNLSTGECESRCDEGEKCCEPPPGGFVGYCCPTDYVCSNADEDIPKFCCPPGTNCCGYRSGTIIFLRCCDPNLCESCSVDGCVYQCDPNTEVCCDGTCKPKCQIVDGADCSTSQNTSSCGGCALHDSCSHLVNAKVYEGGKEQKCNPRGCPGDCNDDIKLCYTEYPCKKGDGYRSWATCVTLTSPPPPLTPQPCWPPCCEDMWPFPFECYPCVNDELNKVEHKVDNDSCN